MYNIYDSIENIQQVKTVDMLVYSVSKREVINKDFTRIRKNLEILKKFCSDYMGRI